MNARVSLHAPARPLSSASQEASCNWGLCPKFICQDTASVRPHKQGQLMMQARKLIQEDELEALSDGDELTQARRAGLVFPGWLEGPLHFPPTYKFRHVSLHRHDALHKGLDMCRRFCNIPFSVSTCIPIIKCGCAEPPAL